MKLRQRPSLNALRCFEAVARHDSMTLAATELSVTPGAVSRQMAELQAQLSFTLFEGARRQRVVTPAGRRLAAAVGQALDGIDETLLALDDRQDRVLDVQCLSSFAIRWLIPRLYRLQAVQPGLDIRLSTTPRLPDGHTAAGARIDVAIEVLAAGEAVMARDRVLFAEALGPVMAPSVAKGLDLSQLHRVAQVTSATRRNAGALWVQSLAAGARGTGAVTLGKVLEFDHLSFAIEAAANGLGLCVAPRHLVGSDLASGRLVAPFGFCASGYTYVARIRPNQTRPIQRRGAGGFLDWLQAEISADEGAGLPV